jgi:hypothetical protein
MSAAVNRAALSRYASELGQRSYEVRLERFGIEYLREVARLNGKKGGRPPKQSKGA